MNDQEQQSIESLKYQLRQWREVVNMHLPHTDCDRDDPSAISNMITKQQQQITELVEIAKAVVDGNFNQAELIAKSRRAVRRIEGE